VFCNPKLLKNIRTIDKELHLHTNAGKAIINEVGDLQGIGTVWFHKDGIANVLSLNGVANTDGYRVSFSSLDDGKFKVINPNGVIRRFVPSDKGFYYWDCTEAIRSKKRVIKSELTLSKTKNLESTNRTKNPKTSLLSGIGPRTKGKTARKGKSSVPVPEKTKTSVPVPENVKTFYQKVTLSIDDMDHNNVPFLTSISEDVNYDTTSRMKNVKNDIGITGVGSKVSIKDCFTKPKQGKMFETYRNVLLKGLDENYLLYLKGHGLAERDIIDDG
jgi:hypothetical protein